MAPAKIRRRDGWVGGGWWGEMNITLEDAADGVQLFAATKTEQFVFSVDYRPYECCFQRMEMKAKSGCTKYSTLQP